LFGVHVAMVQHYNRVLVVVRGGEGRGVAAVGGEER
jgi:hypothetical protein